MADLIGYPFESKFDGYDEQGNPIYDRAIASATFRAFWAKYFTTGVFFDPATNFQVLAAGGLNIDVNYGEAHIRGLTIQPDEANSTMIMLPNALTTGDRTDLIVLRADFTTNRSANVYVLSGKSAVSDLQRDDSVWELALAKVVVRRNATTVNQSDITDLRLNTEYCGVVTEPITRTNTQQFFVQIDAMISQYQLTWNDFFGDLSAQTAQKLAQWEAAWNTFFTKAKNDTTAQIESNQAAWDAFFASVEADIGALLEHATIRQDQVVGLSEALDSKQPKGNYITTETDPTVSAWAKAPNKPTYTATEVGADPTGTATSTVNTHNASAAAHAALFDAKATTATYTVTLSAEWSGSEAPYTQTVTVSGMLATDAPFADVVLPDDWTVAEAMIEDWGKVARVTTAAGGATFYATEPTSAAMTVQMKVVR